MTELFEIVFLSLKIALLATFLVMLGSIFIGYFSALGLKIFKIIEILSYLPMAMPPVALGYSLLWLLGPNSFLGQFFQKFNIDIAFSFLGAVLACFCASLGIGVKTMKMAFLAIDPAQKQIALLQGARPWQIFYYIVLPQCKKSLMGGAILVFIRAVSEFGATMVLVGTTINNQKTLATAIWVGMQMPNSEKVFLLVLISLFLSVLAILGSEIFLKTEKRI
jgi:molybdate transport system permease protein